MIARRTDECPTVTTAMPTRTEVERRTGISRYEVSRAEERAFAKIRACMTADPARTRTERLAEERAMECVARVLVASESGGELVPLLVEQIKAELMEWRKA